MKISRRQFVQVLAVAGASALLTLAAALPTTLQQAALLLPARQLLQAAASTEAGPQPG